MPLKTAALAGTVAIAAVSRQNQDLIPQLLKVMTEIIACSTDPVDAASLEKLLVIATDIRGVAATLGSPMTTYTVNTIFRLAERAVVAGGLSRSLLMLLTESNTKLLKMGKGRSQFEPELRELLTKLNANI